MGILLVILNIFLAVASSALMIFAIWIGGGNLILLFAPLLAICSLFVTVPYLAIKKSICIKNIVTSLIALFLPLIIVYAPILLENARQLLLT